MSLDIGDAFGEGFSRTFARNGLLLATAFAVVALVFSVLGQTLMVGFMEAILEWVQGLSPQELNVDQGEYEEMIADFETQLELLQDQSPFALGLPLGLAAIGLVLVAIFAEAVSIVAVRAFATGQEEAVTRDLLTDDLLLATLNGFIGSIVVWGVILVGLVLFVLPGIFFAVAFLFVRQEIALKNKNFVQAMADSWRFTKGHRLAVFAVGAIVVVVSQLDPVASALVGVGSIVAGEFVSAALGGILAAFGAAVVTRAYVQLDRDEPVVEDDADEADPYDAALGADDIPK